MGRNKLISIWLLLWYLAVSVWMAQAPVDPQFWLLASILPALFGVLLIVTHRGHSHHLSNDDGRDGPLHLLPVLIGILPFTP